MRCKKAIIGACMVLILSISLCSCVTEKTENTIDAPMAENEFNISILKIGQADAIILKTENHTAVIDCGEDDDGAEVVEHLTQTGTETIDYLFITHYDKDHVGGASEVLNGFEANEIIMPDYVGTSDEYEAFTSTLEEKNITPTLLSDEMSFVLDDVLFEIYPPQKNDYKEPDNDHSLVISVTHGDNKFLFAGDAEKDRLSELSSQLDLDHDFLKMPHHGKYNKETINFLKGVTPTYTVVCDSDRNPAEETCVKALETIGSEVYHMPNVCMTTDSMLLARIFINLISNAYSYGKENGTIEVTLSENNKEVIFSVADDGIGIAEEHLPKIWERFYQVNTSRTNRDGSMGLGLSMVKLIADKLGAKLTVKSKLGEGTTFTLVMPK